MALTDIDSGRLADNVFTLGKNLIDNGAMRMAQRGASTPNITTGGYYSVDRHGFDVVTLGTWTNARHATDPAPGFDYSFRATCTTADATPAAADYALIYHRIEAQNLSQLKFGTAAAETLTLSFWVKSNKTGNASINMLQLDNSSKQFSATYNIAQADTWEHKTISVPADAAGVIDNDTGPGLQISWWLNAGSDWTGGGAQSTWAALDDTKSCPAVLGVGGAVNDYFDITGIQLELGDVATPFEHLPAQIDYGRCLRYYYQQPSYSGLYGAPNNTYGINVGYYYPVAMRAAPTATTSYTATFALTSVTPVITTQTFYVVQYIASTSTNASWTFTVNYSADL